MLFPLLLQQISIPSQRIYSAWKGKIQVSQYKNTFSYTLSNLYNHSVYNKTSLANSTKN